MRWLAASALSDAGGKFESEWHSYFVVDLVDHAAGKLVFNLATGLRDGRGK